MLPPLQAQTNLERLSINPGDKLRAAIQQSASLIAIKRILWRCQTDHDRLQALHSHDPSTRMTPLALAAQADRTDLVATLLEAGSERLAVSKDDEGNTILHIASEKGSAAIVELYARPFPFVIDWANSQGYTPLHVAVQKGELEIAKVRQFVGQD